jgi:hypothetical protein
MNPWVLAAWSSFLSACLLEGVVFAVLDPTEIHAIGSFNSPTRQGVYTVTFFLFWLQGMVCASLALWLYRGEKT